MIYLCKHKLMGHYFIVSNPEHCREEIVIQDYKPSESTLWVTYGCNGIRQVLNMHSAVRYLEKGEYYCFHPLVDDLEYLTS